MLGGGGPPRLTPAPRVEKPRCHNPGNISIPPPDTPAGGGSVSALFPQTQPCSMAGPGQSHLRCGTEGAAGTGPVPQATGPHTPAQAPVWSRGGSLVSPSFLQHTVLLGSGNDTGFQGPWRVGRQPGSKQGVLGTRREARKRRCDSSHLLGSGSPQHVGLPCPGKVGDTPEPHSRPELFSFAQKLPLDLGVAGCLSSLWSQALVPSQWSGTYETEVFIWAPNHGEAEPAGIAQVTRPTF